MKTISLFMLCAVVISCAGSAYCDDRIVRIQCESVQKSNAKESDKLWPDIYLKGNRLCFNVAGWTDFKGQGCVVNGGTAHWSGVVILFQEGESLGRDYTEFRAVNVKLTDQLIEYSIEWRRSGSWVLFQRVSIDRLTGGGVNWDVRDHGGTSMECKAVKKKI